jgi:two-component system, OmpR family, sensor histidine kinase KdpD
VPDLNPARPAPAPPTSMSRWTTGTRCCCAATPLAAADRRIVEAFAAQAAPALRQERLSAEAAAAKPLAAADRMRTALLAAVSHDLRTPLASAKAAVAGLLSDDVHFDDDDRRELLETADVSLDRLARLARLVANLLDMSRLQAGALGITAA